MHRPEPERARSARGCEAAERAAVTEADEGGDRTQVALAHSQRRHMRRREDRGREWPPPPCRRPAIPTAARPAPARSDSLGDRGAAPESGAGLRRRRTPSCCAPSSSRSSRPTPSQHRGPVAAPRQQPRRAFASSRSPRAERCSATARHVCRRPGPERPAARHRAAGAPLQWGVSRSISFRSADSALLSRVPTCPTLTPSALAISEIAHATVAHHQHRRRAARQPRQRAADAPPASPGRSPRPRRWERTDGVDQKLPLASTPFPSQHVERRVHRRNLTHPAACSQSPGNRRYAARKTSCATSCAPWKSPTTLCARRTTTR